MSFHIHNNHGMPFSLRQRPDTLPIQQYFETEKRKFRPRAILRLVGIYTILIFVSFVTNPATVQANRHSEFPEYAGIKKNISFWEKIYSTYSINTAVFHDQDDLSKIYGVVHLKDKSFPHARKENVKRIKAAKKKYSSILKKLSTGAHPATREEVKISAMFTGSSARRDMRKAAENIRYQNGLKERFYEGAIRSVAYIRKIRRILMAYGLPADLAYLPHVESSFNPNAHSKSGARGMWQFTRSTGRQYMKINRHIDQRKDPFISTRAAAKLLKKNYEALGSWPLAITAYNYGTSGMMRAVRTFGDYEAIFKNYNQGYFKFASRNFYSEFLAARKVAKRLVGTKIARGKDTRGRPLYKIKTTTLKRIASTRTGTVQHIRPLPRRRFYTVKRGDTASSIAAAHNISVHTLCKENKLGPKAVIYIGQNLKIPEHAADNDEKMDSCKSSFSEGRSAALPISGPRHHLFSRLPQLAVSALISAQNTYNHIHVLGRI